MEGDLPFYEGGFREGGRSKEECWGEVGRGGGGGGERRGRVGLTKTRPKE